MVRKSVIDNNNIRYADNCYGVEDYKFWCDVLKYGNIANMGEVFLKYALVICIEFYFILIYNSKKMPLFPCSSPKQRQQRKNTQKMKGNKRRMHTLIPSSVKLFRCGIFSWYHTRRKLSQLTVILLCLYLILSSITKVQAADQPANQTVKAGIFYLDGYHMKDEEGNLCGYGIDFLNFVSEHSHLNFEFTGYDKSFNETLDMLESGAIDVVTPIEKTKNENEKFAYSLPIGRNSIILSVRADDERRHSGDYSSYDGMVIGITQESSQKKSLVAFAQEKGFSFSLKEYETLAELEDALQHGSVDASLSSDLRRKENEKTLDTVTSDHFYAVVRKEDTKLLDEINYAIEQMHMNEGDWMNVLFYKYYGPVYSSALVFNKREKAYIQDVLDGKKSITVTAMGDRKPYSYVEDGKLTGILPDYFDRVMKFAGLPYEVAVPQDRDDYNSLASDQRIDVVIDKRTPDKETEKELRQGFLTNTYMRAGMAKVTRKDFHGKITTASIAEAQGDVRLDQGDIEIIKYETREGALQAVLDAEVDAAYVYTYTAQLFVNNDYTDSLHFSIVNEVNFEFHMYVRNSCDHELVTILNKCIQQMPEDELNQLVTAYTSYTPKDMTLMQYLAANPGLLVSLGLSAVLAAGTILYLYLRAAWNKKMLVSSEQSNRELEAQLSIVDALSRDYINVFAIDLQKESARVIKSKGYINTVLNLDKEKEFSYGSALQRYVTQRVHPDDQQMLTNALALKEVRQRLRESVEYTGSFHVLSDDEIHNYQFVYVKMKRKGLDGEDFVLAGFRNIDEVVRKEQEQKTVLAEALAEAQNASHAKTAFLNNMSHDIRTPMNAIIGFTSLAASHIESRELVQSYLDKIMTSSRHLLSLINDVLDMSRIESGKVRIDEKEASLPEIMHDLKTIVQSDVKAKQLEFYIDTVDVTNETIICDKLRLNQVLLNILSNAMKYTKPGGRVSVRIIQSANAPKGYASYQFQVKDTGIGMSAKFLEHLFEPFEREQTSTISGIQGTGLGLAITKNIVDMMNGTISVESEEGKGTEFTVAFQFRTVSSPKEETVQELVNQRALIVDDDINTCTSVSRMLSLIGMHADFTTQGSEAVVRAEFAVEQEEPYSVFIIDWLMPDMNGIEIVRRIRKKIGDAASIIIMTAYDWADIEEEAKLAGVTAFCSKPVFLSDLHTILAAPFIARTETDEEDETEELFEGRHLLLAEDNEINQEIAKAILEEAGFTLDIANEGAEAVNRMKEVPADTYDLVLMDIQMPVMNGYEASRQIRALKDPVKSRIPIVAMTANAFEEDRQLALEAGMNGHIAKPIDVDQLMKTIKDILRRRL